MSLFSGVLVCIHMLLCESVMKRDEDFTFFTIKKKNVILPVCFVNGMALASAFLSSGFLIPPKMLQLQKYNSSMVYIEP